MHVLYESVNFFKRLTWFVEMLYQVFVSLWCVGTDEMFVKDPIVNNFSVLPVQLGQILVNTSGGHHVFQVTRAVKFRHRFSLET